MKFSVVIPACDEEGYISKTVKSVLNQDFRDFEVIIVCNGCSDKTYDVVRGYRKVKVYSLKEGHVSKARNFGAIKSKGEILVFLDADTLIEKNVLERISRSGYKLGTCKGKPDNNKFVARLFFFVKNLLWKFVWTNGIIFVDKDVFKKVSGFNEKLTKGEDSEFVKKCKKYVSYEIVDAYVINSVRRFEKLGYFYVVGFWIKERFFPSKERYPVVR